MVLGGDDMAEFCYECWNEMHNTKRSKYDFILSWEKDLRQGCGQYKRVIVGWSNYFEDYRFLYVDLVRLLVRVLLDALVYLFSRLFRSLCLARRRHKRKKRGGGRDDGLISANICRSKKRACNFD